MPANIPIQWLRSLIAVAEVGTGIRAARETGIVQSSASHHVCKLEEAFGRTLFDRRRPKRLLEAGSYRRGETIAVAATFARPVTVTETPGLALTVGTALRQVAYARGSGARSLVFEYKVVPADSDTDGIAVAANALALNRGTMADSNGAAAVLGHAVLAAQADNKVDGSLTHGFSLAAGICSRTPAVRDAPLLRVRAQTVNTALGCRQVMDTHLGAVTGSLHLGARGVRTLKAGDFAGLSGISVVELSDNRLAGLPSVTFGGLDDTLARLDLSDNALAVLPAGIFGAISRLAGLDLQDNGLSALPAGVFAGLDDSLLRLDLSHNSLAALPARLFQGLTGLMLLDLSGNPGGARFRPTANAGADIDVAWDGSVTGQPTQGLLWDGRRIVLTCVPEIAPNVEAPAP